MRCGNGSHVGADAAYLCIAHCVNERARTYRLRDSRRRIDRDIGRTRNLKAEYGLGAVLPGLRPDANRQKSLDGMDAECSLVSVPLQAPGKDTNLVKIKR